MTCNISEACMHICGMYASGEQHQPWHVVSTKTCTHPLCRMHMDKAIWVVFWVHQPCDITYGMCGSTKWHWPTVGGNNKYVHTLVMACANPIISIKLGPSTVSMQHRPIDGKISQGLHESYLLCVHRLGDVSHGMHDLDRWHRIMAGCINQDLHASKVVCAHLATDICLRHATSFKKWTYNLWHVCIGGSTMTLANDRQRQPRLVRFK